MSLLEKLAIRGIRSFSPDDEQTIEFYSPMTMIVGQNGSGKTTIIECLKYACTGKLPPGGASTAGQSWVHDPKLTDDTEVKASIKLRFRARDQKRLVVVRSLQLQYKGKAKNPTFKQLEGVIKTINPITKKSESLGHKCQDLNAFIPQATGISAAILESVVFCHQEESSWPLQDGATLKKKFDDIFESTRYTKALEAIEKCRKGRAEEHKHLRIDLAALTENRDAADVIRRELEAKTAEIQDIQSKQDRLDTKLTTLNTRMHEAQRTLQDLQELTQQIDTKSLLLEERTRTLTNTHKSLGTNEMKESAEELRARLASFSKDQEEVQKELSRLRQKESGHLKAIDNHRAEIQKLTGRKGEVKAQLSQLKTLVEERNKEIVTLCEKYSLELPRTLAAAAAAGGSGGGGGGGGGAAAGGGSSGGVGGRSATPTPTHTHTQLGVELTETDIKRFFFGMQGKKTALSEELSSFREEKTRVLNKKRNEVTELEAKLMANDNAKKHKQTEIKEIERKFTQVTNELHGQTAVPPSVLEDARQEVANAKAAHDALISSGEEARLEEELKNVRRELRDVSDTLTVERRLAEELRASSKERIEHAALVKSYTADMEGLKEKVTQFNESLYRPLLPQALEPTLNSLQGAVTHIRTHLLPQHESAISSKTKELNAQRQRLTQVETNLARDRQEAEAQAKKIVELEKRSGVDKARRILDELTAEFAETNKQGYVFEEGDIDGALKEVRRLIDDDMKLVHECATRMQVQQKMAKDARKEKRCPCCTRGVDEEELAVLEGHVLGRVPKYEAKKMELESESGPRHKAQLEELTKCVEGVKALVPLREKQQEVQARITAAEGEERTLKEAVKGLEEECEEKKQAKKNVEVAEGQVDKMMATSGSLYRTKGTIESKERSLAAQAGGGGDTRTLEQVEASLKAMYVTEKEKTDRVNDLTAEAMKHQRRVINQQELVRSAEAALEEKLKMMSRSQELEKEKVTLKERQAKVEGEIQRATEEEIPLRQELKGVQAEFETLKNRLEAEDGNKQRERIECTQRYNNFDALHKKVKEAEGAGYVQLLQSLEEQHGRLESDIAGAQGQVEGLGGTIKTVAKRLEDKDQLRRQIEENLSYRRMKKEKEEEEVEMALLVERVEGFEDRSVLERAAGKAATQVREAREEKVRNEAKIDTLAQVQQEQQAKLNSEKYRSVEKRFRETKIKCDTTQMAVEDLQKYHKALDRALMQYHRMKIEEINKIIRELWTRTYQGNDIEEIAIVSGEDGAGGGMGRATRSYNYRVVMKKGQTLLDMRGRCSAGQRVLASIVIRLALAETFCINCGVMTLDEPTTNLDHDNKGGLARAIARLIAERSRQQNFQLVVITHDEDFVDMVKQEMSTQTGFSMPEYYWRIQREPAPGGRAYSTIQAVEWGTI